MVWLFCFGGARKAGLKPAPTVRRLGLDPAFLKTAKLGPDPAYQLIPWSINLDLMSHLRRV